MTWSSSWGFEIVTHNSLIRKSVKKCWTKETVKAFCVTALNFFEDDQATLKTC
jgi:hypothetical protein